MKIIDVVLSEGTTGFYFDDQKAIKQGVGHDGFFYTGEPVTPGFTQLRQKGETISIMLILEDGQVAIGECAAVQYSGAGGRDPLFLAADFIPVIHEKIVPKLIGLELTSFKELAEKFDNLENDGKRFHTAIRYGVTQALLNAVAKSQHRTMAEVVVDEYKTGVDLKRIPIFTQSGDNRYDNVDKMIIKGSDVLPHGLINNVEEKLGKQGEILRDYVIWLRERITDYKQTEDYSPVLHIDVYGTIGIAFDNDFKRIAEYIAELGELAKPYHLRIEGPVDVGEREEQIKALAEIVQNLEDLGSDVEIVADEWCNTLKDVIDFTDGNAGHMIQVKTPDLGGVNNTIEALLYCRDQEKGAYSGGTCNETNRSAEILTNIAMACGATQCLAKPGMGVDEGYMIVNNEMNRVLALAGRNKK
ncbi:MAG: methylaspartate ammonia-lyase [Clostridium sp.]|jgi:methylaspartate ammonia-lyase|nr:methylaspartate ammonia-lyase [Clostridium sp.]